MKRILTVAALCALTSVASFGATQVSGIAWTQDKQSSQVTIGYDLAGDDAAVITLDVLTNGVSIGAANITHLAGDVNRLVQPGADKKIYWRPDYDWENHVFAEGEITCRVTAWAKNDPPDYMAVDIIYTNNVTYYTCAEAVPDGVGATKYKTRYLLMRRIHASGETFIMGTPPCEFWRNGECDAKGQNRTHLDETQHPVSFTDDFYIGVYELTVGQKEQIDATVAKTDVKPWNSTTWNILNEKAEDFRSKMGIDFRLPTEAQWEFACRAGTDTSINNGAEFTSSSGYVKPSAMKDVAVTAADHGLAAAEVGTLQPNAWGLYDMHGNADEACSDWVDTAVLSTAAVVDPVGLSSGTLRATRGGNRYFWPAEARSGARIGVLPTESIAGMGMRLSCSAKAVK